MSASGPASPPSGPTPSSLQPMRLGLVVDVGTRILRRHGSVLLIVSAGLVGPAALATAATGIHLTEEAGDVIDIETLERTGVLAIGDLEPLVGALGWYLLATILAGILGTIAALGFSAVVGADHAGRALSPSAALRASARRAISALALMLLTSALIMALIVLGVILVSLVLAALSGGTPERGGPGVFASLVIGVALVVLVVYLTIRWALAIPVMAIEDVGAIQALRRTWHLSGDNTWRTFVIVVAGALASAIIGALLTQLLAILLVDVVAASAGLDGTIAEAVSVALGSVIVAPVGAVLVAVLYFDLRARRDPPTVVPGADQPG